MSTRVAIVGIGHTVFRATSPSLSYKELMFEAATKAYADAGLDPRREVDAFLSCSEDFHEGTSIFDEYVPDQIGGAQRPVYTIGGDALHGLATAYMQILSGVAGVVAVEAHTKASNIVTAERVQALALYPVPRAAPGPPPGVRGRPGGGRLLPGRGGGPRALRPCRGQEPRQRPDQPGGGLRRSPRSRGRTGLAADLRTPLGAGRQRPRRRRYGDRPRFGGAPYAGGGTGVLLPIHGWMHVASGLFDTCLVVAEEKMSTCHPHPQGAFLTIFDNILERPLQPNLLWIFALEMRRYMEAYGITKEEIALVSVKNKGNALGHPAAHVAGEITVQDVLTSGVMVWPVNHLDVSPVSDGAVAIILAAEERARRITDRPVWVDGVGWNLDTTYWTNRDLAYPEYVERAARMAYQMAGIEEPRKEINVVEPYDPFSYKGLHHLEGLLLCGKGEALRLTADGVTQRDGDLPVCPSGGLLGVCNPIAAAGLMKVAEIFWQLRGEAGARQVPGQPKTGLAQAWGDLMQVGTVVVMRADWR